MLTCLFILFIAQAIRRGVGSSRRGSSIRPPRIERLQRLRGFSLTELTVVLLIMAIGTTIALPRLAETVANHRARSIASIIQSDLELARRTAMNRGRIITVEFDWPTATYHSAGVILSPDHSDTLQVDIAAAFGEGVQLSGDFVGTPGIQFDHRGTPSMTDELGATQSIGNISIEFEGATMNLEIRPSMSLVALESVD